MGGDGSERAFADEVLEDAFDNDLTFFGIGAFEDLMEQVKDVRFRYLVVVALIVAAGFRSRAMSIRQFVLSVP